VMRLAYRRYSGAEGFTADQFRSTVEEVAGRGMKAWFEKVIASPGEIDYGEMLGWYGLRFAAGSPWNLEIRPKATAAQTRNLKALVTSRDQEKRQTPPSREYWVESTFTGFRWR
jgi:hypothetical protein